MADPDEGPGADAAIRAAALAYAARDWCVVPLRPRDKVPLIRWRGFQERRPDAADVERWFDRWPDANVGIVTGAISKLCVVDVDPRHGGDDSLAAWVRAHGGLPATVACRTGGGGRHLYFTAPPEALRGRAGVAAGIDVRAEGGPVVAPPSVHPSGRRYAWQAGRAPADIAVHDLPAWLERLVRGPAGQPEHPGHPVSYWRALARDGVAEGVRNSTIASFAGHLLWHGVDPDVARELLLCWNRERCRPPLDDAEVERVLESIVWLHGRHED